jgi:hypothetical protein
MLVVLPYPQIFSSLLFFQPIGLERRGRSCYAYGVRLLFPLLALALAGCATTAADCPPDEDREACMRAAQTLKERRRRWDEHCRAYPKDEVCTRADAGPLNLFERPQDLEAGASVQLQACTPMSNNMLFCQSLQ